MKNNKGFTLIELLAVILILGIIALIAIPTVTSVVEQSRKGAFESTANNIVKELENECMENMLTGGNGALKITFNNGVATPSMNLKGSLPNEGYAISNTECQTRIVLNDSNYYAEKDFTDDEIKVSKNSERVVGNTNLASKKEIIVSRLTTTPNEADYNTIKAGATQNNSILVKVHPAGKTYSQAGYTFEDATSSHKWMIVVHGYTTSENGVPVDPFLSLGYNVVTPRMYYWGNNTAPANMDHTWGWNERKDLHTLINYIISIDPSAEIVLYGGSMGAATVAMLSGDILPSNVKAIIEDSGYLDLSDQMNYMLSIENNEFTLQMSAAMGYDLNNMSKEEVREAMVTTISTLLEPSGYKFGEISAIKQVRNATLPMLFMHGSGDELVNPESAQRFYDAANLTSKKDIFISEGACHTCACFSPEYRTEFYNKISTFLSEIGM